MNIQHEPFYKQSIDTITKHYGGTYVCTTDLYNSDMPVDVFYTGPEPHEKFGNRYYGLFHDPDKGGMICNADYVEKLTFGMILDDEGTYHYSQSHHDYKVIGEQMIDGGRQYIRSGAHPVTVFSVKDGEFIKVEDNGSK